LAHHRKNRGEPACISDRDFTLSRVTIKPSELRGDLSDGG
jgi:hypothetical protein